MEYRQYLINNATVIMNNNQSNANINCSPTFLSINNNRLSLPVLFKSVTDQPLPHNSDLKKIFLDYYIKISNMFSPGIMHNE